MKEKVFLAGADTETAFETAKAAFQSYGCEIANDYEASEAPAQVKAEILQLIQSESVYLLAAWKKSEKATLAREIAAALRLSILYEVEPRHPEIKQAIKAVMGVPFGTIAQDSRNRWHVYARMIYAHHCKKAGENTQQIAKEIGHDDSSIYYYLRKYEGEYKYNREFRKAAEKVATLLSEKLKTPHGESSNN